MFSNKQVKRLNQARTILREIEKECGGIRFDRDREQKFPDGFDLGKLAECCDHAENAIFNVLNVAHSHLNVGLTEEQIHNRKEVEV